MPNFNRETRYGPPLLGAALALALGPVQTLADDEHHSRYEGDSSNYSHYESDESSSYSSLRLDEVKWESGDRRLVVKGTRAGRRAEVTVTYAGSDTEIASFDTNWEGSFEEKIGGVSPVPCRVRASSSTGSAERSVENAPSDCSDTGDTSTFLPGSHRPVSATI